MNAAQNLRDMVTDRPFTNGGLAPVEPRFPGHKFRNIRANLNEEYLIDDVLPAQGLAFLVGDPDAGKTFCALDFSTHVSSPLAQWNGKDVLHGSVAYFAAESQTGFFKRVDAVRTGLGLEAEDLPLFVYTEVPDMGSKTGDIDAIERALDRDMAGNPPMRLIVFDTLNKVTAGHDENSAAEMGILITNAYRLAARFKCLVLIVHHPGKGGGESMRGSGALRGGGDAILYVSGAVGETKTVEITRQKDGASGVSWTFDLVVQEIGVNAKGKPVTSCYVKHRAEPAIGVAKPRRGKAKPLSGRKRCLMDAIEKALAEVGETPPGTLAKHASGVTRAVKWEEVKRYAKMLGFAEGNSDASWPKALEAVKRDLKGDYIGIWGEWVWTI